MEVTDVLNVLFRWIHIVAGVMWVGFGFWIVLVQTPSVGELDPPTRAKLAPVFLPRALYFFRWSSIYAWVTGIFLLGLVFYHGGIVFEDDGGWGFASILSLVIVFGMYGVYNLLIKSGLGKNFSAFGVVALVIVAATIYLMREVAGFTYRAYNIHLGAMFGTIMLANGMRIAAMQRRMMAATKEGKAPDQGEMELAGILSKHSVYLSVPLIYTMINMHTVVPGANSIAYLFGATLVGWLLVAFIFNRAGRIKGS